MHVLINGDYFNIFNIMYYHNNRRISYNSLHQINDKHALKKLCIILISMCIVFIIDNRYSRFIELQMKESWFITHSLSFIIRQCLRCNWHVYIHTKLYQYPSTHLSDWIGVVTRRSICSRQSGTVSMKTRE